MSVVSKNPFDLLGDDGEEQSPAPVAKAEPAKKTEASAPQKSVPGSAPRGGATGRGARYPSRGGPRNVLRENEARNTSGDGAAEGFESGGFDGERVPPSRKGNHNYRQDAHTKGPRGTRPARDGTTGGRGRGSRVPAQGGERRQFERRSGTYQDSQKKVDQGWGADEGSSELKAEVEGEKDAVAEENTPQTPAAEGDDGGWGAPDAPATTEAQEAPAAAEPAEPEEIQKSYDEYLAERASQALGKPKGREVSSEGVEGTAFVREAIDEFFTGKEKAAPKAGKTVKKEKIYIEVDGQFASPAGRPPRGTGERGRGGRGGRGAARGAGRGAPRGGRGRGGFGGANINPTDESAFPALGA